MAKKTSSKTAVGKAKPAGDKPAASRSKQARTSKVAVPTDAETEAQGEEPKLEISTSRNFIPWLRDAGVSLAFTTYQASKIFLLGLQDDNRLSVFERTFERCMGLWAGGDTLFVSSVYQIWRFQNALKEGQAANGFDRLYIPQVAWTTGDLDVHDLAIDKWGRPVFVNTLFGCLATVSDEASFVPLWKPPFISKIAAEDRCHLNGMAMEDGVPRYVTAVAQSDAADGWREHRQDGGCVIDVRENKIVGEGFSMPHSPRLYRDKLWLFDSGRGQFGWLDPASGTFEPLCFCPGYLRGLTFTDKYAIVGLSKPRERTFSGLHLDTALAERKVEPQCGLMVIDLDSGDIVHWLKIAGIITELYDVSVLKGVRRPSMIGVKADDIKRTLMVGDMGELQPQGMAGTA